MTTTSNPIDRPKYSTYVVYDTAAVEPVQGADANHSVVICDPVIVQIDTLPAATSVQVQQKCHPDAEWVNVGAAITEASGASMLIFDHEVNFVQLVRTGAGDVKAYAQGW
jgi:hypothetical protein